MRETVSEMDLGKLLALYEKAVSDNEALRRENEALKECNGALERDKKALEKALAGVIAELGDKKAVMSLTTTCIGAVIDMSARRRFG